MYVCVKSNLIHFGAVVHVLFSSVRYGSYDVLVDVFRYSISLESCASSLNFGFIFMFSPCSVLAVLLLDNARIAQQFFGF